MVLEARKPYAVACLLKPTRYGTHDQMARRVEYPIPKMKRAPYGLEGDLETARQKCPKHKAACPIIIVDNFHPLRSTTIPIIGTMNIAALSGILMAQLAFKISPEK